MFGQVHFPHPADPQFLAQLVLAELPGFVQIRSKAVEHVTAINRQRRSDHQEQGIGTRVLVRV
jgi:hypothetical protein